MAMKIASVKKNRPSIANPIPTASPKRSMKCGHSNPISKERTVTVTAPTANRTATARDQRSASLSASGSQCRRPRYSAISMIAGKATPRRRLLRSRDERMLTGVAGGTAQYLGGDPTFVRLGFAAATLFGGFCLLAYVVMAVVVPEDAGGGVPATGRPPTWAIVLLALAALVILPGPFFGWGDGIWFLGFGTFWLVALVVAGALAYRAWRGEWPGRGARAAVKAGSGARKGAE